ERISWLRAAVLGANDGIVSTSSLVVGVAAASTGRVELLLAAIAGLVAGAMSMAAGEYVSVSSQEDTEKADIEREKFELTHYREAEHEELANIYIERGLDNKLATQVAEQLMLHDALDAHTRDEPGLSRSQRARPILAASSSAVSFFTGALLPVLLVAFVPMDLMIATVAASSLVFLSFLGFIAAKAGGANVIKSMTRVTLWGSLAMAVTAAIGNIFGTFV
ncbi:MAG: VIT family protein, partial [Gammaproteobacteria bacterium]